MIDMSNLSKYSDEKLCEMIVAQRYLNLDKNISVICMQELVRRRDDSSNFEFEEAIEKMTASMPVIEKPLIDTRSTLKLLTDNFKQKI